jgi:hypothetical protein
MCAHLCRLLGTVVDPGNWFAPHAWLLGSHDPDGMCTYSSTCVKHLELFYGSLFHFLGEMLTKEVANMHVKAKNLTHDNTWRCPPGSELLIMPT